MRYPKLPLTAATPPRLVVRKYRDHGLRWLFNDLESVAELAALYDPSLPLRFDFGRAVLADRTLIPPTLLDTETDLLVDLPFVDPGLLPEIRMYFLLENHMHPERGLPLKILSRMVAIWQTDWDAGENLRARDRDRSLQPIAPFVFHLGTDDWHSSLNLIDLMRGADRLQFMGQVIPAWETRYLSLKQLDRDRLLGGADVLGPALWVLQGQTEATKSYVARTLDSMQAIRERAQTAALRCARAFWFITMMALHGRPRTEWPELSSTLSDESVRLGLVDQSEVTRTMQSMADVWEEEAEARAEARAEAKVAAQLPLLVAAQVAAQLPTQVAAQVAAQVPMQVAAQVAAQVPMQVAAQVAARLAAERAQMLRSVMLRMAEKRFGKLPPEVTTALDSVADEETLNVMFDRATDVGTVGEWRALWPGAGTRATG